jgi:tryptophan synthase beta subunit
VVYPGSSVVTQARAVTIQSNDATDAFSAVPSVLGESGVFIHADKTVAVDSAVSSTIHKANIESAIAALKKLTFKPTDVVVLTVSGRGDKDVETYLNNKLMAKEYGNF